MDWFVRWLNQYAGAISATATLVIAAASVVSARIIHFEKKREKADRMPILTFADQAAGGGKDGYRELYVKNVGYGPALNIVRKIIQTGDLLSYARTDEPLVLGALAPTERAYALAATLPGHASVSILDDPQFHAVIECDDILDEHYEFVYQKRTHLTPVRLARRKLAAAQAHRI
jgi:hypothetical protein